MKIEADTDLYETDKEVQNLIDWVCLSEQIKENNNTIRNRIGEYQKIGPDCHEGVRAPLERKKCGSWRLLCFAFQLLIPCALKRTKLWNNTETKRHCIGF